MANARKTPPRRRYKKPKKSHFGLWVLMGLIGLVGLYAFALEYSRPHVTGDVLKLSEFTDFVGKGRVQNATLLDADAYAIGTYTRPDGTVADFNSPYISQGLSDITKLLLANKVDTTIDQQTGKKTLQLATYILPGFILILLFTYMIISYRRGSGLFRVRSGARKAQAAKKGEAPKVTFADVAGQPAAIAELKEIGQFLSDPDRFFRIGADIPKGILLYGPPGCGKTLMAKALAAEEGANFLSISGSDFIEVYVGVGAARVRDLFKEARENAPSVIFIDELDSIGRRRGGGTGGTMGSHPEQEQALNAILTEMDGFSPSDGIIVVGATNRPDILDPALLRPGRFDRSVGLERPDEAGRLEILKIHSRRKTLAADANLPGIARKAVGLNGADLANVMNEAALLGARAGKPAIGFEELDLALKRVLEAPDRQKRLSMRDRGFGQKIPRDEDKISFDDVAGQDQAVAELREIEQFLVDPKRYSALGGRIPRGVLLYGPPGSGKTLLARALASEANATFYSVTGTEFMEVFVGEGAARVRDLFAEARSAPPAIIFIDEIDAIGRRRGGSTGRTQGSNPEQEQTLNQLLTELDGFTPSTSVIVIGSTNRPDALDPALLRTGRFDRTVALDRPDEQGRFEILKVHARDKVLAPDVDLLKIGRRAIGMSGSDLANILNESALMAAREGKPYISQEDLEGALKRILEAPDRQRRLSMRDRGFGRKVPLDDHRVTFKDIAGQDAAVAELREIEEFLTEPERYAAVGARIPRGVLMYGPPGSGKTLLARALATETNASFYSVTATEFVEVFVGEGAGRVRDLFAEARGTPPAIIFIDELDAIGGRRGGRTAESGGGHSEREGTLNQILTEMDGFTPATGVIVIGSTNRPDALDPALLRPGRFDRTVGLERPDEKGRLEILKVHARGKVLTPDTDLATIARRAIGLNGADLANILNEAALLTARQSRPAISQAELQDALNRILEAPDRQRRLSLRDRSFGRRFTSAEDRVTFADVAGADDAIKELAEFRDYLAEPERFEAMGARVPRGVLLVGPPGCGKTLLAKAVAGETNAAFFSVAATEFVEVWVGEGAGRVRDLFAEAKSVAPSILFIDEIDAIGGHRTNWGGGSGERENTLNQILVELDGFSARTGVIIMAATNRADRLDPALVRPGRFDRQVTISLPDHAGRQAILEMYAKNKNVAGDVDFNGLAGVTAGSSGADLANLVNEASLLAARQGLTELTRAVLDEALDRSYMGVSSRGNVMTPEERRIVAYHEAGHALVTRTLPGCGRVHKVSAATRGHALGLAWHHDDADRQIYTRSIFIDKMAAALGGRVAEELVFRDPGSGASSDIAYATGIARRMVREYGMGRSLGLVTYADEMSPDGRSRPYSEVTASKVDDEVRMLIDEAYRLSHQVLDLSLPALDAVARALIDREVLTGKDIDEIAGPPAVLPVGNGRHEELAPPPAPPPARVPV